MGDTVDQQAVSPGLFIEFMGTVLIEEGVLGYPVGLHRVQVEVRCTLGEILVL